MSSDKFLQDLTMIPETFPILFKIFPPVNGQHSPGVTMK